MSRKYNRRQVVTMQVSAAYRQAMNSPEFQADFLDKILRINYWVVMRACFKYMIADWIDGARKLFKTKK